MDILACAECRSIYQELLDTSRALWQNRPDQNIPHSLVTTYRAAN